MAAPTKVGKVWRHQIMVNGKRPSGTFSTKAAALAWEAEMRVDLRHDKPAATKKTCKDAFQQYEIEVSRHKRGYRWEALRLAVMCESSLGIVKMSELSTTHVAAWRDERLKLGVSGATVNREMNLLSHVFATARKEWKWIADSPTADVRRPKDSPPRDRRISEDEIDRICFALGWDKKAVGVAPQTKQQRIAIAFLFAIETAMRAGEICALIASDVNVSDCVAQLRRTKNGYDRDVAMSPRAIELWSMVPDGFDLKPDLLSTMFRTAHKKAMIENLTFHDSRHEAITRLATKLHVLDLARMVGHRDIRQLSVYYNISAKDMASKLK